MTDIFNSSALEEDGDLEVIIQVLSVASAEEQFKVGECMGKHAQYSHSKPSQRLLDVQTDQPSPGGDRGC